MMDDSSFIGRKSELERLNRYFTLARSGRTQICFVGGEAGSGKTALVNHFIRTAQNQHPETVIAISRCNSQTGQGDPYLPFLDILTMVIAGDHPDEGHSDEGHPGRDHPDEETDIITTENKARLKKIFKISAKTLVEHAPDLVGSLIPGSSAIVSAAKFAAGEAGWLDKFNSCIKQSDFRDKMDREQICHQYMDLLLALSKKTPMVIVLDDLQWCDSSSIGLLFHLSRELKQSRILIIGLYRPNDVNLGRDDERHPLSIILNEIKGRVGDVLIDLDHISEDRKKLFVSKFIDRQKNKLGTDFRHRLFQLTSANPFFIYELLENFQETGELVKDAAGDWILSPTFDWKKLPAKVEGVISERIGRLTRELGDLLNVACVEGNQFSVQVVSQVTGIKALSVLRMISQELMERHQLVCEQGTQKIGGQTIFAYRFMHTSVAHYIYQNLSAGEKLILHGEIARVLETLYVNRLNEVSVQLAYHFARSGESKIALGYSIQSARRALGLSAYREAQTLLEEALKQVSALAPGEERDEFEFTVLLDLGNALKALEGWDSPKVTDIHDRVVQLGTRLKRTRDLSSTIFGRWAFHLVKLDLERSLGLAGQYQKMAIKSRDGDMHLFSNFSLCNSFYFLGRFSAASNNMKKAIVHYRPEKRDHYIQEYGQDPILFIQIFQVFLEWMSGKIQASTRQLNRSLDYAKKLNHPFSLAIALQVAPWHYFHLRDHEKTFVHARQLVRFSSKHGFPFYEGIGRIFLGWALIRRDEKKLADGLHLIQDGYKNKLGANGVHLLHPVFTMLICEAYLHHKNSKMGLKYVDKGIEMAKTHNALCYISELYRIKGDLLLIGNHRKKAEGFYRNALDLAHKQKAVSLEFRSAVCLSRFLMDQGRPREAKKYLFPFYKLFKNNPDYMDMQRAETIMDEISQQPEVW